MLNQTNICLYASTYRFLEVHFFTKRKSCFVNNIYSCTCMVYYMCLSTALGEIEIVKNQLVWGSTWNTIHTVC